MSSDRLRRVPAWAARHPVAVGAAAATILGLSLLVLPRLRLQSGIYELFPDVPGPVSELARYSRLFGAGEELVMLVSGADPPAVARGVRAAAIELQRSPLIDDVRAGVEGMALSGAIGPSLLLLAGPDSWPRVKARLTTGLRAQAARLRRLLLSPITPPRKVLQQDPLGLSELLLERRGSGVDRKTGLYASADGRAALIFARPRGRASDQAFCARLHGELERVIRRLARAPGNEGLSFQVTGGYTYAFHMARTLRGDLALSGTLAMGGAVLVLLLAFRSLRLVPMVLAVSGVAVTATLAAATLTVGRLNAMSLAFAALCIGLGVDALIHITVHARHRQGPARVVETMSELAPALIAAAVTTVAAFLTFSLSSFAGLSDTGLLAAFGLALTLALTLVLVPALQVLIPPAPAAPGRALLDRALARVAAAVVSGRWVVLATAAVIGATALSFAVHISFSGDLTRLAPPTLPPARTDRAIARAFDRERNRVIVMIRSRDRERALAANDRLAARLHALRRGGRVVGFRSISGLLPSLATQRRRLARLTALHPERLAVNVSRALEEVNLSPAAFGPFLRALRHPRPLTPELLPPHLEPMMRRQLSIRPGETVVATIVYLPRGAPAAGVTDALERADGDVQVAATGAALAGEQMARMLRSDMLLVSLLSLAVVMVMLALLLRAAWPVLAALLSLLLSGAVFIGALRLLGLEVDLYNLMVLPILIGYGVDDHIYVVRQAMSDGIDRAVVRSGRAVLLTTLTSMAAFGALGLCSLPGLRALGVTAVLGLGLGLVGSLVVMPALLAVGRRGGYNGSP